MNDWLTASISGTLFVSAGAGACQGNDAGSALFVNCDMLHMYMFPPSAL
jgi:hypothetical protein